jgi:hypothetical protein
MLIYLSATIDVAEKTTIFLSDPSSGHGTLLSGTPPQHVPMFTAKKTLEIGDFSSNRKIIFQTLIFSGKIVSNIQILFWVYKLEMSSRKII